MSPNARRDLIIGGSVVIVGATLLAFALFGGEEGFRAPRWVVGVVALGLLLGGAIPLKTVFGTGELRMEGPLPSLVAAAVFVLLAAVTVWVLVAVGPEATAITFDVPLPLSEGNERGLKSALFYGLLGAIALGCLAGAAVALKVALPALGRTAVVAIVAPLAGLVLWIAFETYSQVSQVHPPVVTLSFDRRFPTDEYLAHSHGKEILPRPGRVGTGLFVGGNGDWLDVDAPRGYDTRHGLTLEFWMKRDSWINPMAKGARAQTVASVEVERDWKGRPELQQIAFSMELSIPRDKTRTTHTRFPGEYMYKPVARVGEVQLTPARVATIAPDRWTHVAIVYDRFLVDRMRLYLDGHLVARSVPWTSPVGFADVRTIRIGTRHEQSGAFRGMVDELKLYARALSDDEIASSAAKGS